MTNDQLTKTEGVFPKLPNTLLIHITYNIYITYNKSAYLEIYIARIYIPNIMTNNARTAQ